MTGWTTREAADKCGLTQHTLRWYERIGLLDRVARTADGRRRFSDKDLDWLLLLSKLRATGMPVRDMLRYAELVRSRAGEQERRALLERHRDRVRQALLEQQACLKLLDDKIEAYRDRGPAATPASGGGTASGRPGDRARSARRDGRGRPGRRNDAGRADHNRNDIGQDHTCGKFHWAS